MKKILAIDDNELNLELLHYIIKQHYPDFIYIKASNGKTGIKLAKEEKPELILLDILMPGLNGHEVCKILKNDSQTSHIPVMMISALGWNSEERIKGLNAGADSFISKPFKNSELQAQINVALRIKAVEDLLRKRNESLELSIKTEANKYLRREERFLQISEHARQFYWETDKKGTIVYVSPVIERILNIPILSIIGKMNYTELFQLETNSKGILLSEDSEIHDVEIELSANKKSIWLSFNSFPFFDKDESYNGNRGICFDITIRKRSEIELKNNIRKIERYQRKLKNLNKEISLIEEHERRKIAENLHDGLGQTLSLAYIKLSAIHNDGLPVEVKETIQTTSELLNKAITESRNLTYDLSPPILYELGLIAALKWKLDQIEKKNNISTFIYGEKTELKIKKEFVIFIYRIVAELLQNVLKHANASSITITISQTGKKYRFIVEDDGVGIKKDKSNINYKMGGFGLLSIKERLESLNGHFYLKSGAEKGTKAILEFPVYKKDLE
ncbi:MAG: response regulator [Draconibacterium sp.]